MTRSSVLFTEKEQSPGVERFHESQGPCGAEGKGKPREAEIDSRSQCLVVSPPRVGVGGVCPLVSLSRELDLSAMAWMHDSHPAGICVLRPVASLSAMYLPP